MSTARKITIGQAQQSGATALGFWCEQPLCYGSAEMPISEALDRWGPERRLDTLPLRCSRCGSTQVDVRPHYPRY